MCIYIYIIKTDYRKINETEIDEMKDNRMKINILKIDKMKDEDLEINEKKKRELRIDKDYKIKRVSSRNEKFGKDRDKK